MIIKSTKDFGPLLARAPEAVKDIAETHEIKIETGVAETWDERAERSLVDLQRAGGETKLNLVLRFNEADPASGDMVADLLKGVEGAVRARAAAERPKDPPPKVEVHKVAGYATLGAAGGYCAGLLLQELGRAGQATGNPYISTIAVAMTGLGGVVGTLYGTRDLGEFNFSGLGVSGKITQKGG